MTAHYRKYGLYFLGILPVVPTSQAGQAGGAPSCPELSAATAWETLETSGAPLPRHEAAFVEFEGEFYLLGGRRIQPVSVYHPETKTWRQASRPPIEVHHFQPVVYQDKILIICAMTGGFPRETGLERILIYEPRTDRWSWGDIIPEARRRGSAGVVLVEGKLYVVGGIVEGHMGGFVAWTDRYDPETGDWEILPDAPRPRDHFQCAEINGHIYAAGGRRTSQATGQLFDLVIPEVDIFDISTQTWSTLPKDLPTPRAGNSTLADSCRVIVAGGESTSQGRAHDEVEAWHVHHQVWQTLPPMNRGRHGTGHILFQNHIYTCSGSGGRGGGPELESTERLRIRVDGGARQ